MQLLLVPFHLARILWGICLMVGGSIVWLVEALAPTPASERRQLGVVDNEVGAIQAAFGLSPAVMQVLVPALRTAGAALPADVIRSWRATRRDDLVVLDIAHTFTAPADDVWVVTGGGGKGPAVAVEVGAAGERCRITASTNAVSTKEFVAKVLAAH